MDVVHGKASRCGLALCGADKGSRWNVAAGGCAISTVTCVDARQAKMIENVKFVELEGGPHGVLWTHAAKVNARTTVRRLFAVSGQSNRHARSLQHLSRALLVPRNGWCSARRG